ncbi:MAG: hypothetical protein HQ568_01745 [Calditrichaeota bacterium]|nr:hypothetical protein [Calditrichota bacterium]
MTEQISKSRAKLGRLSRVLILLGAGLLVFYFDLLQWQWWFIIIALLFYSSGLQRDGNLEMLFPGSILLILGSVLLMRKYELLIFPYWQFWPILFGSMGLAFILMWLIRSNRGWVFIPGGLLLFATGGGFGAKSFFSYQRWLRGVINHWYVLLAVTILVTAVIYWRSHSQQKSTS